MIVQTEAFVMPVTIMQMGGKVVVPVARVFASDNDETGILYARAPKGKIFKILTQANIIRFVKTHEAECEKNGRFERIPVEIYSELAQMSANNRLYCFMKRQDLLLKNEEFCRVFCDKFRIPTASSDPVSAVKECENGAGIPGQAYQILQKIKSNTFIDFKAVNCLRMVLGYRSKYVPAKIMKTLVGVRQVYETKEAIELFFAAIYVMNSRLLQKQITLLRQYCLSKKAIAAEQQQTESEWEGLEISDNNIRSE